MGNITPQSFASICISVHATDDPSNPIFLNVDLQGDMVGKTCALVFAVKTHPEFKELLDTALKTLEHPDIVNIFLQTKINEQQ